MTPSQMVGHMFIARVMAEQARAVGINGFFTPVTDIDATFRSTTVATGLLSVQRHRRVLVSSTGIVVPFVAHAMRFALPDARFWARQCA